MSPSEPLGAERVRVERRSDARAGLPRDRPLQARRDRGLGEQDADVARPHLLDQLANVAARGLGLGRARVEHRPDHLDVVALGERAQRVVGGHEAPLRGRHAPQAGGDLAVQGLQATGVGPCVALVHGAPGRVGPHEPVADGADGGDRVARVVPPVGVGRAHPLQQRDDRRIAPGALHEVVEPLIELAARREQETRLGDRLGVAGARLVVVRVRLRAQEGADVGAVAPHVAGEVGDLRGRGHDNRPVARGARVAVATGGEREDRAGGGEPQERAKHGPHCRRL